MTPLIVLVHSPLVGPFTWFAVAARLRQRGLPVAVPALRDEGAPPYWRAEAESAATAIAAVERERSLLLVAHSGAGALLPPIAAVARRTVAGCIFVDAGLPAAGSRLDAMATEDAGFAARLREQLVAGGRFPVWRDDDLCGILPDAATRARLLQELRPRDLAFFAEPLPPFAGWPDAPCGYLRLSAAYDVPASEAHRRGWPVRSLDAGHFHMLVDPEAVARALLEVAREAGIAIAPERRDA